MPKKQQKILAPKMDGLKQTIYSKEITPRSGEVKSRNNLRALRNLSSKSKNVKAKINFSKMLPDLNTELGARNICDPREVKSVPINLGTNISALSEALNEDDICSQIPNLTNDEIDNLINDVNSFIQDGSFDILSPTGGLTSINKFDFPTSPISESILSVDYDVPLDLSTKNNKSSKSPLIANRSLKRKLESVDFMPHHCKIPVAHLPTRLRATPTLRSYSTITTTNSVSATKATVHEENKQKNGFKTTSFILEEILGLQGIKPSYDLVTSHITKFSQLFKYRVWFNDQNAFGVGESMPVAKNSAAQALLDKLVSSQFFGNVIGKLQEMCMARHWKLPVYEDEKEFHSPDGHDFIVSCKVLRYEELGQGTNKKIAKLFAAYKTWMKINYK